MPKPIRLKPVCLKPMNFIWLFVIALSYDYGVAHWIPDEVFWVVLAAMVFWVVLGAMMMGLLSWLTTPAPTPTQPRRFPPTRRPVSTPVRSPAPTPVRTPATHPDTDTGAYDNPPEPDTDANHRRVVVRRRRYSLLEPG